MEALTHEVLDARDAAADRKIEAATREISEAEQEKADIAAARRLLGPRKDAPTLVTMIPLGFKSATPTMDALMGRTRGGKPTMGALILKVLEESGAVWLTANEVQERLSDLMGEHVPIKNVSPKLSDLKDRGLIVRNGLRVALKSRSEA